MSEKKSPDGVKTTYKETVLRLSREGDRTWTGEKHYELAKVLIKNTHENSEVQFNPELADILAVIFNPTRESRLRVLKRYLEREGFRIDPKTEEYLDLQLDRNEFTARLAKLKDPETKEPLIKKQERKGRGKDLDELFAD